MQLDCIDLVPKVTVVVPTFNRAGLLRAAVASVLTQSSGELKLLVIDDGSSEDLSAALGATLEDRRARLVRHEVNKGAAAARNAGETLRWSPLERMGRAPNATFRAGRDQTGSFSADRKAVPRSNAAESTIEQHATMFPRWRMNPEPVLPGTS
jgi:glycosyltransferase involved in cell wall biosynthesis